jgi:hypothetical protein
MVAELRESEGRLQMFLPSLEKDLEPKTQENKSGTGVAEVTAACVVWFLCLTLNETRSFQSVEVLRF